MNRQVDIAVLKGQTIRKVDSWDMNDDRITLTTDKFWYDFHHEQTCCETVKLIDVVGNLDNLKGKKIVDAKCIIVESEKTKKRPSWVSWFVMTKYGGESNTWTEHILVTEDGIQVIMRWFGSSNGYYGEQVDITQHPKRKEPKTPKKPLSDVALDPKAYVGDLKATTTASVHVAKEILSDLQLYAQFKQKAKDWRQE